MSEISRSILWGAAILAHRILKDAKPAGRSVEQPPKFGMVKSLAPG